MAALDLTGGAEPQLVLPESNRAALRVLWRLGGPVALQALLASTLGFVDTMMVSGVGPAALAGVGVVARMQFVLTMMLSGLAGGAGVLVAQYGGARRLRAARGPVAAAVVFGLLLTLPMCLVSLLMPDALAALLTPVPAVAREAARFLQWSALYTPLSAVTALLGATLRSSGDTRTPMWAGIATLGVNTVLNVLFINGHFGFPAYGVAAAAAATSAARVLEGAWLFGALRPGPLPRLFAAVRRRHAALVLQSAGPVILKEIAWAGGVFANTLIISRMGELPLAAYNLVVPVEGIMISLVSGCGVATGILLGHALGRGAFDAAYRGARRTLRMVFRGATLFGIIAALLVQALRCAGWLQHALGPALHDMALNTLSMLCLAFGAKAHNTIVSVGILRSGNDSAWLFWTDLCSMWAVNVPAVAIAALVLHWPVAAVVGVLTLEEVLKVALFGWRVKSGRWLRKI